MKTTQSDSIIQDPIIAEVRQAGQELFRAAGQNFQRLCKNLEKIERLNGERVHAPTARKRDRECK